MLNWTSSGNVGIGTETPLHALHIVTPSTQNIALRLERYDAGPYNSGEIAFANLNGEQVYMGLKDNSQLAIKGNSDFTVGEPTLLVNVQTGNVGIGVGAAQYKLDVCGTIRAKEIRVNLTGCDFVFDSDYKLMSLTEMEQFINEHKHLPEIAPAKEMETVDGVQIGEMQSKLLQKIEELTLYTIQQKKLIEALQADVELLKKK